MQSCHADALGLFCGAVSEQPPPRVVIDGPCAGAPLCPLSQVDAGALVCIKRLAASPEVSSRLRELGLGEEQRIKLVSRNASLICQVCNARVGISQSLADNILVQTLPGDPHKA
jgi:Fe2+ transport system protein FeoA